MRFVPIKTPMIGFTAEKNHVQFSNLISSQKIKTKILKNKKFLSNKCFFIFGGKLQQLDSNKLYP